MIQAVIQNQAAKTIGYFGVDDTNTCGDKAGLFPEKPTPAQLAKVNTLPAGQYRSLCVRSASKITALYVARNPDGALSFYASGSGTITLVLTALGGGGYNQTKVMTTADGPYSRDGLFTGSLVYGSLFGNTADAQYQLLAEDDAGGIDGYVLTLNDSTPAQALKTASSKLTALYVARNSGGSLSFYVSGSGTLTLTLACVDGTSTYSQTKVMTTADGPYGRDGLFTGTLAYGSLFTNVPNARFGLTVRDDAGGQEQFSFSTTDTGPFQVLKAGSSTGGGSGGGSGGVPSPTIKGKIDHISPSRRPDLMQIVVTAYQEADGSWWLKFDDSATGITEKFYRGIGEGSWITLAQLRALRVPAGYLYAISCMQMSSPADDSKINDQTAHCVQFIYTS